MPVSDRLEKLARQLSPRVAIVLGSGLADAAREVDLLHKLPFAEIPGLPPTSVQGHGGCLSFGLWRGVPVVIFQGRLHLYEGYEPVTATMPIRLAARMGIKILLLTNAAGGINPELATGSLVAISKHLKMIGPDGWRSLSPHLQEPCATPYSRRLRDLMHVFTTSQGMELHTGTYVALTGPSYETPAEIRLFGRCGGDVVGMSTAWEAEAAAELGLEVAAISCVTNAAAGLTPEKITHQEVIDNARLAVSQLGKILGHLVVMAT